MYMLPGGLLAPRGCGCGSQPHMYLYGRSSA